MWESMGVKPWSVLRCLLPILAIVGILAAPLAAPAAASAMAPAAMSAMADEMPCCPGEKPAMPDCSKSCPLMTVCTAKCFQNLSTATGTVIARLTLAGLVVPSNDRVGASLTQAPPAPPPRT
jgi:hypothetical protein